jgi:RHS repeat-associated protein
MTYDGLGRLRKRAEYTGSPSSWTLSSETRYIYDGNVVIQQRDTNNTPVISYTRGADLSGTFQGAGGIGGLLSCSEGYLSGNWTTNNFYHADGGGNITRLFSTNSAAFINLAYDPFGNTILDSAHALSSANPYAFSSKELHASSGMYYYGYRFYDPNLQRWINRDPIGEAGFESSRGQFASIRAGEPNRYMFLANNPVDQVDSLGLCKINIRCGPVMLGEVHCGVIAPNGIEYGLSGGSSSHNALGTPHPYQGDRPQPKKPDQNDYPVTCKGSCDSVMQKIQDYHDNVTPPHYVAAPGPNSNSYAHNMLDAAGCNVDPIQQCTSYPPTYGAGMPGAYTPPTTTTTPPSAVGWNYWFR